jgi:nucleoside-diphosphate-sugar epimerase
MLRRSGEEERFDCAVQATGNWNTLRPRVLVVGASGFVGNACAEYFQRINWEVLGVGRTQRPAAAYPYEASSFDASGLEKTIARFRPQFCLNAAGASHPAPSMNEPTADFDANVRLVHDLLEALRKRAGTCRYIGFSSAAVYGENPWLPWSEQATPQPTSPYGYHKRCAELIADAYARIFSVETLSLRAFSIYGPGLRKQLFWDVYQRARLSSSLVLAGSGQETRDFIYIDDVTDIVARLFQRATFDASNVLNLASGMPVTIAAACARFLDHIGWRGEFRFSGSRPPGSPARMEADMARAARMQLCAVVPLEEGLSRTAAWLSKNADDAS